MSKAIFLIGACLIGFMCGALITPLTLAILVDIIVYCGWFALCAWSGMLS